MSDEETTSTEETETTTTDDSAEATEDEATTDDSAEATEDEATTVDVEPAAGRVFDVTGTEDGLEVGVGDEGPRIVEGGDRSWSTGALTAGTGDGKAEVTVTFAADEDSAEARAERLPDGPNHLVVSDNGVDGRVEGYDETTTVDVDEEFSFQVTDGGVTAGVRVGDGETEATGRDRTEDAEPGGRGV